MRPHLLELAYLYRHLEQYAPSHRAGALRALRALLDRIEDVRAGRLEPLDPKVTEAMVDAKVALDDF